MRARPVLLLAWLAAAIGACDDAALERVDAGDSGTRDLGSSEDLGTSDDAAGSPDARADDLGGVDLGSGDTGPIDLGADDTSALDAGDPCALPSSDPPDVPRPLFPWNGATWGSALAPDSLRPRFRWRPSERAGCYQVHWGTTCDATRLADCRLPDTVDGVTARLELTPDSPLAVSRSVPVGSRYYWQLRACNAAGCSDWSRARYLDLGRLPNDVDGDGDSEVIAGCRSCDSLDGMVPFAGALFVYDGGAASDGGSGLDVAPLRIEPAERQTFSRFGNAVAAGDIDGDGFADVVVGAPTEAAGVGAPGAVYVYRGSASGLSPIPAARVTSTVPDGDIGFFGATVAVAGDIDGDGDRDVVIGAPGESSDGVFASGTIHWLPGTPDGPSAGPPILLAHGPLSFSAKLGFALAPAGDLDGDGLADVVASAAGYSPEGMREMGRLVAWRGTTTGDLGVGLAIDASDPEPDDLFGSAISGGQDVDDDGLSDVLIGADQRNVGPGQVRIAYGDETALLVVGRGCRSGLPAGADFGGAVLSAGDLDDDGISDLVASAPGAGGPIYRVVHTRRDRPPICEEMLPNRGGMGRLFHGFSLASADVDGDGIVDLLVGSPAVGPYPDDPLPEAIWLHRRDAVAALPNPFPTTLRPQELPYSLGTGSP